MQYIGVSEQTQDVIMTENHIFNLVAIKDIMVTVVKIWKT